MFFIADLIKVLQIRRQGLDITEIVFTVTLNRNSTTATITTSLKLFWLHAQGIIGHPLQLTIILSYLP